MSSSALGLGDGQIAVVGDFVDWVYHRFHRLLWAAFVDVLGTLHDSELVPFTLPRITHLL